MGTATPPTTRAILLAVHPHKRGDSVECIPLLFLAVGSPPQAWGQRGRCRAAILCGRFTPTSVGTASIGPPPCRRPAVHPHKRGDSVIDFRPLPVLIGSPPQAWGQRLNSPRHGLVRRFTPTSVGTATSAGSPVWRARGSPPQAWGQPSQVAPARATRRFTPTSVGTAR